MGWISDKEWNNLIARVDRIERKQERFSGRIEANERRDHMSQADTQAAIEELKAKAARQTTVTNGLKVAFAELKAAVEAAGDDPEEIRAAIAEFDKNTDDIVAMITQGTPVEDEPTEPVVP